MKIPALFLIGFVFLLALASTADAAMPPSITETAEFRTYDRFVQGELRTKANESGDVTFDEYQRLDQRNENLGEAVEEKMDDLLDQAKNHYWNEVLVPFRDKLTRRDLKKRDRAIGKARARFKKAEAKAVKQFNSAKRRAGTKASVRSAKKTRDRKIKSLKKTGDRAIKKAKDRYRKVLNRGSVAGAVDRKWDEISEARSPSMGTQTGTRSSRFSTWHRIISTRSPIGQMEATGMTTTGTGATMTMTGMTTGTGNRLR